MIGTVDEITITKATALGINIAGGSINKRSGRVLVFVKGKYPGAHKSGFALRSRVVWWINTGEVPRVEIDIHHENTVRVDDRFENLKPIEHTAHSQLHNPKGLKRASCSCKHCGQEFTVDGWRTKDHSRGRFCSQSCYHSHARSAQHIAAISDGLKRAYSEGRR